MTKNEAVELCLKDKNKLFKQNNIYFCSKCKVYLNHDVVPLGGDHGEYVGQGKQCCGCKKLTNL